MIGVSSTLRVLTALIETVHSDDVTFAHFAGLTEGHVGVRNGHHGGLTVFREGGIKILHDRIVVIRGSLIQSRLLVEVVLLP